MPAATLPARHIGLVEVHPGLAAGSTLSPLGWFLDGFDGKVLVRGVGRVAAGSVVEVNRTLAELNLALGPGVRA